MVILSPQRGLSKESQKAQGALSCSQHCWSQFRIQHGFYGIIFIRESLRF